MSRARPSTRTAQRRRRPRGRPRLRVEARDDLTEKVHESGGKHVETELLAQLPDAFATRRVEPGVGVEAQVAQARIGQPRRDVRRGIVLRAVVDDDAFPIGEALPPQAVEGTAGECWLYMAVAVNRKTPD